MAKTLQNVIDRLRVISGDKTSIQWADSDIARWASDGQTKLIRETESNKQLLSIGPSVIGQVAYPVNVGYLWVHAIYFNGVDLSKLTLSELDDYDSYRQVSGNLPQGTPQWYWLTKDTINLYPAPDTAGFTVTALCSVRPVDVVNNADSLVIPDEQFETLVRYCLQMAKESDEDWDAAAYYRTDVKERLAMDAYQENHARSSSFISIRNPAGEDW